MKLYYLVFFSFYFSAFSVLPQKMQVVSGKATISENGLHCLIKTDSSRTILQWESFSVGKGNSLQFVQPNSNASVLNRVTGNLPSHIAGKLTSNGQVYLLNQNGILFAKGAVINTKSLVVSTLDVSNASFLEGKELFFNGSGKEIINQGKIQTEEGTFFIAPRIENEGEVEGSFYCAAGTEVLLCPEESSLILIKHKVEEKQLVDKNELYSLGIKNSGKIEAKNVVEKEGRIFLLSDKEISLEKTSEISGDKVYIESLKGNLFASGNLEGKTITLTGQEVFCEGAYLQALSGENGGVIQIGGGFQGKDPSIANAKAVYIDSKTVLCSSALNTGDGGKIVVWGDKGVQFLGSAIAKGGKIKGNGGFVEISSMGSFDLRQKEINTTASNGKKGKLLLDPPNVSIGLSDSGVYSCGNFNPDGTADDPVNVLASAIVSCLDTPQDVEIATSAGSSGPADGGTITVATPISWTENSTLTLTAQKDVVINETISASTGSLVLTSLGTTSGSYIGVDCNAAIDVAGTLSISAAEGNRTGGYGTDISADLTASEITINATGGSSGSSNGGVKLQPGITIGSTDTTSSIQITGTAGSGAGSSNDGGVIMLSDISTRPTLQTTSSGSIQITGTGGPATSNAIQHRGISFLANFSTNSLTLTGTGGSGESTTSEGVSFTTPSATFTGDNSSCTFLNCTGGQNTSGSNNVGVKVNSPITSATTTFNNCRGGTGTGTSNIGVQVSNDIDSGTITFTDCVGGEGTSGNAGIYFSAGSTGNSATTSINVTGTGGTGANNTSGNIGILIENSARITTSSSGTAVLTGTGGGGASGTTSNHGISIGENASFFGNNFTFTGVGGTGSGSSHGVNITSSGSPTYSFSGSNSTLSFLNCSGGTGGSDNYGVVVSGVTFAPNILSFSNCTGGTGGDNNYGVFLNGVTLGNTTATTSITIEATGGAGGDDNYGFYLNGGALGSLSSDPEISITGSSSGSGVDNFGIYLTNSGSILSRNGSITLNGTPAEEAYGIQISGDATVEVTGGSSGISFLSSGDILLGTSTVETSSAPLLIRAGTDLVSEDSAAITTGSGDLILVADNLFPTAPLKGTGSFSLESATITSSSGIVQLYSVSSDLDTLPSTINGASSSSVEGQHEIYYPDGSGGSPFALFYKESSPPPTPSSSSGSSLTISNAVSYFEALSEGFQNRNPTQLGNFLGWDAYPPLFTSKNLVFRLIPIVERKDLGNNLQN